MLVCQNPACRRMASSQTNLCRQCAWRWLRRGVPAGGFISSLDLRKIGRRFMVETAPSNGDVTAALRIMRGTRYRQGPWEERPAYRVQPLLKGRWNVRLPHLLVGRRRCPSLRGLEMAIAHYHLARSTLGAGSAYASYLAGATWYCRKVVAAPDLSEVLKGGAKSSAYLLHVADFGAIGRTALKAGEVLGLPRNARWVGERLTALYLDAQEQGHCRPPVVVPFGALPTRAAGDNALDHFLPVYRGIPREHQNSFRRATGLIKGEYPVGLDLGWEEREAARREQANPYSVAVATQDVPTDWIFEV